MPRPKRATVAAGFVTGMLAGLVRAGRDGTSLLDAAGIARASLIEPTTRVPLERYTALYSLLSQTLDDEAFGLFSSPMRIGSFELLCRAVATAPTLTEALARTSRYLHILLPDVAVATRRESDAAYLTITEQRPPAASSDDPGRVFAFEWLLRLIHALACWLVGRGLALDRVSFPYPRPPHADDYALIYTEDSAFGAKLLEARFDPTLLELPIRRDEEAIRLFLQGAPAKITALYRRDREMVLRVRDLLQQALPASLDLDQVASTLHLSQRTLHRRLADEGANFRAIKDALRRDLALAQLAKSRKPIAAIAAGLGYTDTSAFFRAFTNWTGMAPSVYRERAIRPAFEWNDNRGRPPPQPVPGRFRPRPSAVLTTGVQIP
jgi:AraC-like DNA-binding protein